MKFYIFKWLVKGLVSIIIDFMINSVQKIYIFGILKYNAFL